MEASHARRKKTQPSRIPRAEACSGTLKGSRGALIEGAGLKGFTIGGAQVSELHANFIVNTGGATARDVMDLIDLAKRKVYEAYGIELQPEVRFLGFS